MYVFYVSDEVVSLGEISGTDAAREVHIEVGVRVFRQSRFAGVRFAAERALEHVFLLILSSDLYRTKRGEQLEQQTRTVIAIPRKPSTRVLRFASTAARIFALTFRLKPLGNDEKR